MDQQHGPGAADFTCSVDGAAVSFVVDEEIYPRDAIYGAAFLFLERCYVRLSRPADGHVGVRLKTRAQGAAPELEAIAGDFANELLNQVMRRRVGESTARIREFYMAKVFSGSNRPATIEALLAELDEEELAEDPLSIAVPWEKPSP